jgi:hypothetical protein
MANAAKAMVAATENVAASGRGLEWIVFMVRDEQTRQVFERAVEGRAAELESDGPKDGMG